MPCLCRSIWTGGPASSILDEVPAETPHQYSYVMITRSSQRYCCTVQCKGMKTCRKWCIGLKWHTNWLGKTYISSLQTPNNYFLKLWQHTKNVFWRKKTKWPVCLKFALVRCWKCSISSIYFYVFWMCCIK